MALHQAESGVDSAAKADQPGLAVLWREPWRIELVVHRRRAEIPQDGLAGAGEQRPARKLVTLPFADLGRGDVADVVDVEHQERAEVGVLEGSLNAREPVAMQAAVIDPFLQVDPPSAQRRPGPAP